MKVAVLIAVGLAGAVAFASPASAQAVSSVDRNGIKREDPTGAPFDPNLHQSMGEQESAAHPPGAVAQAWTPAWTLNGRLLRPAMVLVAKAAPKPSQDMSA